MPANIKDKEQLLIEFADTTGATLSIWVPRGKANSDMDKVNLALQKIKGISEEDALLFSQSMEDKMMEKRRNKNDVILDCYVIKLEKECDVNKVPQAVVFRTKEDSDMACVVVLEVPSLNDYSTDNNGINEVVEF